VCVCAGVEDAPSEVGGGGCFSSSPQSGHCLLCQAVPRERHGACEGTCSSYRNNDGLSKTGCFAWLGNISALEVTL